MDSIISASTDAIITSKIVGLVAKIHIPFIRVAILGYDEELESLLQSLPNSPVSLTNICFILLLMNKSSHLRPSLAKRFPSGSTYARPKSLSTRFDMVSTQTTNRWMNLS
jgi:hypothetical protein